MRVNSTKFQRACVIMAALAFVVLSGCAKQAQDVDMSMSDDAGPESSTTEIPENAETLADVIDSFSMPSSFRITMEEGDNQQVMAMMMDGEQATKMRVENTTAEGTEIMIMDFEAGQMLSYNTGTNEGFSMPVTSEQTGTPPAPWEDYDESTAVTGSETINGVDTWVVEMEQPDASGETITVTAWIGKEDGLTRQVKQGEKIVTMNISDVNSVPESDFKVPSDVEMTEMPMMGGPGAPEAGDGAE